MGRGKTYRRQTKPEFQGSPPPGPPIPRQRRFRRSGLRPGQGLAPYRTLWCRRSPATHQTEPGPSVESGGPGGPSPSLHGGWLRLNSARTYSQPRPPGAGAASNTAPEGTVQPPILNHRWSVRVPYPRFMIPPRGFHERILAAARERQRRPRLVDPHQRLERPRHGLARDILVVAESVHVNAGPPRCGHQNMASFVRSRMVTIQRDFDQRASWTAKVAGRLRREESMTALCWRTRSRTFLPVWPKKTGRPSVPEYRYSPGRREITEASFHGRAGGRAARQLSGPAAGRRLPIARSRLGISGPNVRLPDALGGQVQHGAVAFEAGYRRPGLESGKFAVVAPSQPVAMPAPARQAVHGLLPTVGA